jgi:hypothetical protein
MVKYASAAEGVMLASRWGAIPVAALLVAASAPAERVSIPAPLPTVAVPRLDSNGARVTFALRAELECKGRLKVSIQHVAGTAPVDHWIGQTPDPGSSVACDGSVTVDLSDGSIGAAAPVPTVPASPSSWRMPDITVGSRLLALQQEARRNCQAELPFEDRTAPSDQREGTVLGQDPPVDAPIGCGTRIALIRAGAMPPPPVSSPAPNAGVATPPVSESQSLYVPIPSPISTLASPVAPFVNEPAPASSTESAEPTKEKSGLEEPALFTTLSAIWLSAALVVLVMLAAGARRRLRRVVRPHSQPKLEAGAAIATASVSGGMGTGTRPLLTLVALEAVRETVSVVFTDGIPVRSVETDDG